jgi:predicted transcriptional regulator of viral defense system
MRPRSLSPTEARVVLALESDRVEEVGLAGLRERAAVSPGHARKLAHGLVRKGWLQRIGRGRYLLNPSDRGPAAIPDTDPLRLGRHLFSPYYFGYATAAELLGLLPQASGTYYLVTPETRRLGGELADRYRRVHVPSSRFFGTRRLVRRGETLVVSDLERTVLDCLERPSLSGGLPGAVRVLESAGGSIDWGRLERYRRRLRVDALDRRLAYLVDRLRPTVRPPAAWIRALRPPADAPLVPLGARSEFGGRGPRDPTWRVLLNVPERLLFGEVDVR